MTSGSCGLDLLRASLPPDILRKLATHELWRRGDLSFLVRRGAQEDAYRFVKAVRARDRNNASPIVCNIRRGAGKTYLSAILAYETCLGKPNATAFLVGPQLKQILGITSPALQWLHAMCPPEFRPERSEGGALFRFPNGSILRVVGAKEDAAGLRGFRADYVAADELALFDQAEYVLKSVVTPFFVGRDDPFLLVTSTPPVVTGHYFVALCAESEQERRYICIPASRDSSFDEIEESKMLSVFKSKDSVGWKREMECELIADPSCLVIPSFSANRDRLIHDWPRPDYFYPFIFGDMGFVDASAFLFAYLDFENQRLVIEDEVFGASLGTRKLAAMVASKRDALFKGTTHFKDMMIYVDATPRELDDLRENGVYATSAKTGEDKWDLMQGLARLEAACAEDYLAIHPRCTSLIFQLTNAQKNTGHTGILRQPDEPLMGHADALMALAYGLWRTRPWRFTSPFPSWERGRVRAPRRLQPNAPPPQPPRIERARFEIGSCQADIS